MKSNGDLANDVLSWLFGSNWANYLQGGMPDGSAGVLFQMLAEFNHIILLGLGVFGTYVTLTGMVGTAHDGKPLGDRYHSLWTPVRLAGSVALLAPIPGVKLSVIQGIVLVAVSHSVGFANTMWSYALDFLGTHAGAIAAPVKMPPAEVFDIARGGLVNLTYQEYVRARLEGSVSASWAVTRTSDAWVISFPPPPAPTVWVSPTEMGSIRIPCPGADISPAAAEAACAARKVGTLRMLDILRSAAQQMASENVVHVPEQLVSQAISAYAAGNDAAIARFTEQIQGSEYSKALNDFTNAAKREGWIAAGSWYWTVAKFQSRAAVVTSAAPAYTGANDARLAAETGPASEWGAYRAAVDAYFDHATAMSREELRHIAQGADRKEGIAATLAEPFSLLDPTSFIVGDGSDPVASLQRLGNGLVDASAAAFVTYAGARALTAGEESSFLGKVVDGASGAVSATGEFLKSVQPVVLAILAPIFLAGIGLAYYLPAVPYVLWIMAVAAWLVLVLEALVAAPLWAFAHAIPEGDGPVAGHARQGYMLLIHVLFRPPLMIIGLFVAMAVMTGGGYLLAKTFVPFASGMVAGATITGLITYAALTVLLAVIALVLAHSAFSLITHLADTVLNWVGQQVQTLGEHHAEQQVRAMAGGVVSHTSTATDKVERAAGTGAAGKAPGGMNVNADQLLARGPEAPAAPDAEKGDEP